MIFSAITPTALSRGQRNPIVFYKLFCQHIMTNSRLFCQKVYRICWPCAVMQQQPDKSDMIFNIDAKFLNLAGDGITSDAQ